MMSGGEGQVINIHAGHRERMKRRFAVHGLDNFDDVNVLELMLYYVRPRCDTNETAHNLIARFGSLDRVLEATIAELASVKGVGEATAVYLHLIPEISRRYMCSKKFDGTTLKDSRAAGEYAVALYMYEREEALRLICLDNMRRVLSNTVMSRGTVNATAIDNSRILKEAVRTNASSVIIMHNHVNSPALPSNEDIKATKTLFKLLEAAGIELSDHIIVSGRDYYSLASQPYLFRI